MHGIPPAYKDRLADLMDALRLGDIEREEFIKRMQELGYDYYDAISEAKLVKGDE